MFHTAKPDPGGYRLDHWTEHEQVPLQASCPGNTDYGVSIPKGDKLECRSADVQRLKASDASILAPI